jgi:hypothetical protein
MSIRKVAFLAVMAAPVLAHADTGANTFDPTTYVTAIIATIAGLLAIGGAVFSLNLAIKSTKWARRAL